MSQHRSTCGESALLSFRTPSLPSLGLCILWLSPGWCSITGDGCIFTHNRFWMAMRTRLSSTSASAEIFWTWRNPSM